MTDIKSESMEIADLLGRNAEIANQRVKELLIGKSIEIIDNFHDQPFGTSKPNQRGKVVKIRDAYIDAHGINGGALWVFGEGLDCGIPPSHWKFV